MVKYKTVHLDDIVRDPEVQPRVTLIKSKIEEYAENYREGVEMPAIEIHEIDMQLYLCDGWHRDAGSRLAGRMNIYAAVHEGSTRARLMMRAVQANALTGIPLTASERRNSVVRLVESMIKMDEPWTQQMIADATGYTQPQVSRILSAHFGKVPAELKDQAAEGYNRIVDSHEREIVRRQTRKANTGISKHASPIEIDMDTQVKRVREHTDKVVVMLRQMQHRISLVKDMPCGSEIRAISDRLDSAFRVLWEINAARPIHVCGFCQGRQCQHCRNRGWLTQKEAR